ncbi:MAG: hypothetical protein M0Z39_00035 [Actinomycetota bacterium]|nr:hypothetical protein [Actinomycetota bacterium]
MASLQSSTSFEGNLRSFELYFKALVNRDVTIEEYASEEEAHYPDTSTTIRLPRSPGISKRGFYRLALAHRALHFDLGSFDLELAKVREPRAKGGVTSTGEGARDLEVFFSAFSDVQLAQLIFEIFEDARVDVRLPILFPGLEDILKSASAIELQARPGWGELAPRKAATEFLLRKSLDPSIELCPSVIRNSAEKLSAIFGSIDLQEATVEDVAIATIRAYAVISQLPNLGVIDASELELIGAGDSIRSVASLWPSRWPEGRRARIEGDDVLLLALPSVSYRGSLSSFFTQAPTASGPDHQAVYRMSYSSELDEDAAEAPARSVVTGPPEPLPHDHHDVSRHLHHREEGELRSQGPSTFVYPEWDVYINRYRNNWCRVVQRQPLAPTSLERSSLQIRYANELRRLRRIMDIPASQAFIVERRTSSGSDIDYDAAVDAMIDFRVGGAIHDSVYQDLRKKRRDISVLLLLDISASTAERVEGAEPIELPLSPEVAPHPKLRPPRILDIEVISSLLCASVLSTVGDAFSIWAFSGTGREQVVLSEIKGFNEPLSGVVVSRAAGLKPIHATRLGSAVRHCGMLLSKLQSETKVLLVLTDGRPYDIDYGTGYGEEESLSYALEDSDKALSEIVSAGIEPYVITVDPSGEEYISKFRSVRPALLNDVKDLPERLLRLYKGLLDRNVVKVARHASHANALRADNEPSEKVSGL